jgi:hypothetical protein
MADELTVATAAGARSVDVSEARIVAAVTAFRAGLGRKAALCAGSISTALSVVFGGLKRVFPKPGLRPVIPDRPVPANGSEDRH